jgi:hypothetical protein
MDSSEGLATRYSDAGDQDLRDFLMSGPDAFTPDAWQQVVAEAQRRGVTAEVAEVIETQELTSSATVTPQGPVGLGGGIAVFQALVAIQTILFSFGFISASGTPGMIEFVAIPLILLFPGIGLYLTATRSRRAPGYWKGYLLVGIAGSLFLAVDGGAQRLAPLALLVPWFIYWQRSKRVRATFLEAKQES